MKPSTIWSQLARVRIHSVRIWRQLGARLAFGPVRYRVRGYIANKFPASFAHEPFLLKVLERALASKRGAFIDIGVNVGQTLIKVLAIDPHRTYVGFEPQIGCCFFVHQFLADNLIGTARVIPLALSDSNGMISLYSRNSVDEMATIIDCPRLGNSIERQITTVSSRIGDEVLKELDLATIGVIKIDVEGAELQVLSGLTRTLSIHRPILLFEVLPNFHGRERTMKAADVCAKNSAAADAIYAFLIKANYRISQIGPKGDEIPIERFNLNDQTGYMGHDFVAHPVESPRTR